MIPLTIREMDIILAALPRAVEDVEQYLKYGKPEADYVGDEAGLEALKSLVSEWRALEERMMVYRGALPG